MRSASLYASLRKWTVEHQITLVIFLVYSLFSSPIPVGIGAPEIVITALLGLLTFRATMLRRSVVRRPPVAIICMGWIILVPTVIGVGANANALGDYVRDFLPLLFLLLPLILYPMIKSDPGSWLKVFKLCFMISGMALSVRYFRSGEGVAFEEVFTFETAPLNQCPTVIFGAIAGLATAMTGRSPTVRILSAMVGVTCLTTLVMAIMRAQIAIVILAVFVILASGLVVKEGRGALWGRIMFAFVIALSVTLYYFDQFVGVVYWAADMISVKNSLGGGLINGRDQEALEIIDRSTSSLTNFILGEGWGAKMFLPSANSVVRFAHQGMFYFLWKTGFTGLVAIVVYGLSVTSVSRARFRLFTSGEIEMNVILVAALSALVVYTGIEMGYKIVTYGFMLCVIQALAFSVMSKTRSRRFEHEVA